jgi:hypothetical protein
MLKFWGWPRKRGQVPKTGTARRVLCIFGNCPFSGELPETQRYVPRLPLVLAVVPVHSPLTNTGAGFRQIRTFLESVPR